MPMTIKVQTFDVDDADLEAGFAQAAQAHLDATGEVLAPEVVAASAFEAYRGAVKGSLSAKVEKLQAKDIAEVAALVDAKLSAAAVDVPAEPEPPVGVPVGP